MTNNPTIDGVSRELLERIIAWLHTDDPNDGGWVEELRALLDAPVVERQSSYVLAKQSAVDVPGADRKELGYTLLDGIGVFHSAEEVYAVIAEFGFPLGWVAMTVDQLLPGYMMPIENTTQPEVAALQSTIAQLQARIAELESGKGEPVANCFERRNGAGEWVNDSKTWADGMPCAEILNECEKYPDLYRIRSAYAAPPAQVAVVLPELESAFEKWWEEDGQYCRAGGGSYEKTFAYRAYEACLDATAALNGERK